MSFIKDKLFNNGDKFFIKTFHNRYLQANEGLKKTMQTTAKGAWETWTIVKKYGFIYLYNEANKRLMRLNSNGTTDLSAKIEKKDIPKNWSWERFHIIKSGDPNKYGLWNPQNNKVVKALPDKKNVSSNPGNKGNIPNNWTWERFEFIKIKQQIKQEVSKIQEEEFYDDYQKSIFKNKGLEYGFLDRSYFNKLYVNMKYDLENIFDEEDVIAIGILLHDLSAEQRNYINIFSTLGKSQKTSVKKPEGANYNIWWKQNNGKITHAFSKVIYKLICCTGKPINNGKQKSLLLKVPSIENNKISIITKEFFIETKRCSNINGDNYNDDNRTKNGAKSACLDFMVKYCLFLKKYLPDEVKELKQFCGCLLNDNMIHGKHPKSIQRSVELSKSNNMMCIVKECKDNINSYKPSFMREEECRDIVDCSIQVGDISASQIENSEVTLEFNQQCGGNEELKNTEVPKEEKQNIKQEAKKDVEKLVEKEQKKEEKKLPEPPKIEKKSKIEEKKEEKKVIKPQEITIQNYFEKILNWFTKFFMYKEGFSKSKKKLKLFFYFYVFFSIIIINLYIFNDVLKIKKISKTLLKFIYNIKIINLFK